MSESPKHPSEFHLRRLPTECLNHLVDHLPVAFWVARPDLSEIVHISPGCEEIWGRSCEELNRMGPRWIETVHDEDRQRIQTYYATSKAGQSSKIEFRIVRPDGSIRWILDRGFAVCDRDGKIDRLVGMIEDITTHVEAEAERDRFFEMSLDLLCVAGMDGYFRKVNSSFERTLGYSQEELLGSPFLDFVHPDDRDSTLEAMQQLAEGKDIVCFENRYLCKDGRYVWLEWSTPAPLPGETSLYAVARDVTKQQAAQTALEESEARYRELFENANDIIVTTDLSGTLMSVNKAFEDLFGYTRNELVGKNISLVLNAKGAKKVRQMIQRKLKTGLRTSYQIEVIGKSGTIPVEVHSRLIYKMDEPIGVQAIATDIRERLRHERQLFEAKEAAETASRAKSEFLANMSHEIRTPMHAVIGMTELVLDTELSARQRDYLETSLESAESLMSLINEILDFSKIESGKIGVTKSRFDLRDSLGEMLRWLALRAHQRQLELAFDVDTNVPFLIIGDALRLRQIIINLVGNAIKFTRKGHVLVRVKQLKETKTTTRLQFSVEDSGIGIPAEKIAQVFHPFEQADTSMTRQFGGTGLGLAIAKRLIDLMDGEIWVESTVGKGTTFHFVLKFGVGRRTEKKTGDEARALVGINVLLIDDNAQSREFLASLLLHWGMNVKTADSGQDARRVIEEEYSPEDQPGLLIVDLEMPNEDGLQLVESLRAKERLVDTPVILLTTGVRAGGDERANQIGVSKKLLKPVKHSDLYKAILNALSLVTEENTVDGRTLTQESQADGSLRILLVEDGLANQKLALGLLTKWGHHVEVANNGLECVNKVAAESFDLVLMDVQMPIMDGLEATRLIREREAKSGEHIPIIAMTAHAMTGDREKCLAAGMDDYMTKPVRKATLEEAIKEFVEQSATLGTEHARLETVETTPNNGEAESEAVEFPSKKRMADSMDANQIDWQDALENFGGDQELLKSVIDICLMELPRLIEQLRSDLEANAWKELSRNAHTLKGSVRHFGDTKAGQIAQGLESTTSESDVNHVIQEIDSLEREVELLLDEMKRFVGA